jgi:glycosyltransferase involved in cell wall biosynthesis
MKIVIWTGPAWETWGPDSLLAGGIGGSETAAIHMAAELARAGHEVEVIGQVIPCLRDGVEYLDYRPYLSAGAAPIECDVIVISRHLEALRILRPRAQLSCLWVHDIHVGDDWQGLMKKYDIVWCLSEYSRKFLCNYYPEAPRDKFVLTRNAIDPRLFLREPKKEGCKIVYSSSPDRGLDRLLDYWPDIRAIRPDAELHVYYGFSNWEKMSASPKDKSSLALIAFFKERLARMESQGVFSHGRVGQGVLARAFLSASMWLYPTNFHETSCITAMEAQAAGLHIVTSRLAALTETVRYGRLVEPPNTRDGYKEEFLGHVKALLETDEQLPARACDHAREWALRHLSWTKVAQQWEEMFVERLGGK